MRQLTPFIAAIVVLSGCTDNSPLQQNPPALNALIVDGAHSNGNKDFFFLPPLVPSPVGSPNYDAGKFNARLSPFVEVCELNAVDVASLPTATCKSSARVFGPARMTLDASSEQYQLNWDTKTSALIATSFYRIFVSGSSRGTILGSLDVDPVLGGMKNVKTGDVYVFQDGRTLPINVRIEQGAFGSSNSSDAVEQVVSNVLPATGLDVTTNTGFAGAHFSNGWLPLVNGQPLDQVVVIIERVAVNDGGATRCLNTSFEQLEGCYRFRTDPDLHTLVPDIDLLFRAPVVAGVCFQFPGDVGQSNDHPFELYRSEEIDGRVTPAQPLLDEVPAPFLRCDSFGPTPPSIGAAFRSGRLGDIAKAGWFAVAHTIGRIIQPRALYAVDLGAGGSTNEFSRFGFVRPASMSQNSGDGAIAPAGSTVQASVKLQNNHTHGISEVDEISPVVGQSVTFSVTSGGGTVSTASCSAGSSCPALTVGPDGIATVSWQLGLGVNTLAVTTDEVSNSPQIITATGTPSALGAYEVATSNAITLPALTGFARDVATCPAGKVVLGGGTQVVGAGIGDFNTRLQESAPGIVNAATNVWLVSIDNEAAVPHDVQFFAVCATAPYRYAVVATGAVIAAGSFARETANCPAGTVVLGGGAQVAGENIGDFNTRLEESGPGTVGGTTNVWLASVRNEDEVPHTVRIFAVCASPPLGYEVVTGAVTPLAAGGGFNRNAVDCPAGKVILGGGAQVVGQGTADFNTRLQESTPGLTGLNNATNVWLVSMKNLDAVAHNVQFFAVCANAA